MATRKKSVSPQKVSGLLTHKNYHSDENTYLSNSKINDYLKDPRYFKEKHIDKTLVEEPTDALILGQAVDTYLFYGKKKFEQMFKPVARRDKKLQTSFIQLNQTQYTDVLSMVSAVQQTSAWRELKQYDTQRVFAIKVDVGKHFTGLCGMLDTFYHDTKTNIAYIVDLKTAKTIDPKSYFWHCRSYGYFRQMAMYSILVEHTLAPKKIVYRHLTVEKDPQGLHHVQTFEFHEQLIEDAKKELLSTIQDIKNDTEFARPDASFEFPILIGGAKPDAQGFIEV